MLRWEGGCFQGYGELGSYLMGIKFQFYQMKESQRWTMVCNIMNDTAKLFAKSVQDVTFYVMCILTQYKFQKSHMDVLEKRQKYFKEFLEISSSSPTIFSLHLILSSSPSFHLCFFSLNKFKVCDIHGRTPPEKEGLWE